MTRRRRGCACRPAARGWRCAARQSAPVELQHIAHTTLWWYGVCAPARLAAVRFGCSSFLARAPPLPSSRGASCELTPRRRGVAQPVQLQDDAPGAGGLPRLLRHEPRPVRGALRAAASSGVGRPCVQPAGQRVLRRPARPHVERTTLTRTQLRIQRGSMAALGLRAALAPTAAPTLHTAHLGTEAVASPVRSLYGPLPAQSRPPHLPPIPRHAPPRQLRPRYFPRVLNGSGLSVVQFGTSGNRTASNAAPALTVTPGPPPRTPHPPYP